jgi:hypothetical protein
MQTWRLSKLRSSGDSLIDYDGPQVQHLFLDIAAFPMTNARALILFYTLKFERRLTELSEVAVKAV